MFHWRRPGRAVGCSTRALSFQPGSVHAFANVSALRATAQSLARLAEDAVRFFADHDRHDFLCFLWSRSTLSNAGDLLTALGATAPGDCAVMLLDHESPPGPRADIPPITTPAQLVTYRETGAATGWPVKSPCRGRRSVVTGIGSSHSALNVRPHRRTPSPHDSSGCNSL
jgi:hypothetical protein